MEKYADEIEKIRQSAYDLHKSVNQTYGDDLPYGYHLDMVVQGIRDYGHLVCVREDDVLPLFFGGYYHDSMEDARMTYNDVKKVAGSMLTEEQALMAYQGIRETPYAPFVKLCDRLANITYSCAGEGAHSLHMKEVYKHEMPHFLPCINPRSTDQRFLVPQEVVLKLAECLIDDLEREEQNQSVWWHEY